MLFTTIVILFLAACIYLLGIICGRASKDAEVEKYLAKEEGAKKKVMHFLSVHGYTF